MILPCYLAMTAAEFDSVSQLPEKIAWMACHFSCYSTGLSNLPPLLPKGSMLIVNDRTPVAGHDPDKIVEQLCSVIEELEVERVLLDLQRPGCQETAKIAAALTQQLPCPTGVTEAYAKELACPVFLSPPVHIPLETHLAPWTGREIWLELMPDAQKLVITREGCTVYPFPEARLESPIHQHKELCCQYHIDVLDDSAVFTLVRSAEQFPDFLREAEKLGVTCAIGLYQELNIPEES